MNIFKIKLSFHKNAKKLFAKPAKLEELVLRAAVNLYADCGLSDRLFVPR